MKTTTIESPLAARYAAYFLRHVLLLALPLTGMHMAQAQGEAEHAYLITIDDCDSDDREKAVWDALVGTGMFVRLEVVRKDQQVKMLSNVGIERATLEQALLGTGVAITSMVDLMTGAHLGPDTTAPGAFVQPGGPGGTQQDDPAYTLAKQAWIAAHPNWRKEHPDTFTEVDIENE